jgi:hypothetical protein
MKKELDGLVQTNTRLAKRKWFGDVSTHQLQLLRSLTETYGFAVALGDLLLLEGRWYVTHAGLLRLGQPKRCSGINATLQKDLSDPSLSVALSSPTEMSGARCEGANIETGGPIVTLSCELRINTR